MNDEEGSETRPVAVVGLGVFAASFAPLVALFSIMPRDSGAAFVVVSESREAVNMEALLRSLNEGPGPSAQMAEDGQRLEADRIYLVPIGAAVTLEGGRLRLAEPQQESGHRGTVDTFLISLAEEQRESAVALILRVTPDAGSIGAARMKACGGLVLAELEHGQKPVETQEPAGAAGMADLHGELTEIPGRLAAHFSHLRELDLVGERRGVIAGGESRLPAICTILRNRTGHDFQGYKSNTFLRRIQRRMHVLRLDDLDAYIARLGSDAQEAENLFQDLLIGVTQFFRDAPEFERLETEVIPDLLVGKGSADTLRVWVLGCATGEEAYSLAMLLREATVRLDTPPHVQIFATDIDARALAVARTGRYPQTIEKDVSPERLARWFVKEGGTYAIHKDLREMCIFSAHNVIKDAPFSRIDLVSCRNLLIYLNADLQDRVIPLFHFSLRAGGYLFLGPSENVTRHGKLFQALDRKHRIFQRLQTANRILPEFPLSPRVHARRPDEGQAMLRALPSGRLGKRAERLVERHAPAYVVADAEYQVLNFSGRTGPFLDPSSGVANLNLLNLVHRDLRMDLRAALLRVAADRRPARVAPLRMGLDGEARRVGITVEPLAETPQEPIHFVVLFHDYGADATEDLVETPRDPALLRDENIARLEGELRVTKDRLQATIEELESTNEELKSSNEEFQSINEEMQSANEELETSKEELQSVNEELQTVNGELGHRVGDMARANSDLKNLLEATQIATLFLDNELRVKNFTPGMSEIFHLIDSDLGRPITHIALSVPYPEMAEDLRRVLRTLTTIEREIGAAGGNRYMVRVLPYRSVDNFIAGAVLTFLDVTTVARAREALRASDDRARLAASAARIVTWHLDLASGQFSHSEGSRQVFGFPPPPTLDSLLSLVDVGDREALRLAFTHAMEGAGPLDAEARLSVNGKDLWVRFCGNRSGEHLLGVFQDVGERRLAQGQQSLLMAELRHRVKNILAVVRSVTRQSLDDAETLGDLRGQLGGRLDALARAQGLLANRGGEGVELEELVLGEIAASGETHGGSAEVEGPSILLKDKAAETFALALHELTTNAVKYGALCAKGGRLAVRWEILNTDRGQRLNFEWLEQGVAMPASPSDHRGFGRRLIEDGLPRDLDATTSFDFLQDGLHCTVILAVGPQVVLVEAAQPRNVPERPPQ